MSLRALTTLRRAYASGSPDVGPPGVKAGQSVLDGVGGIVRVPANGVHEPVERRPVIGDEALEAIRRGTHEL